jgi:ATP-dependent DNA helicase RecQ
VGAADWRRLIDHLLFEGLFEEDANDGRPLIALGDQNRVREIYQGREAVGMRRPAAMRAPPARSSPVPEAPTGEGARLFEALRTWRKAQASLQRLPPYVIFHDKTLWEIALQRPTTLAALGALSGVGQGKTDRYGDAVLKIVHALTSQD